MNVTDVQKLFCGVAAIYDNDIENDKSSIFKVKQCLLEKHIPVATSKKEPSIEDIDSLQKASFVILDWDFSNNNASLITEGEERILGATELKEDSNNALINFLKEFIKRAFVPVFIFTSLDSEIDYIKERLQNEGLINKEYDVDRIFVELKENIDETDKLFNAILTWLKKMPVVYSLKAWEMNLLSAKNSLFVDLYSKSPKWCSSIWEMVKKDDPVEYQHEFGEYISRLLLNRIEYSFADNEIDLTQKPTRSEINIVVEAERYICYPEKKPDHPYTGDIYCVTNDGVVSYFMNIRAQCDTARVNSGTEVYCLKGKELPIDSLVVDGINLKDNSVIHIDKDYPISEFANYSPEDVETFNAAMTKYSRKPIVNCDYGTVIGKKDQVIIPCICGNKVICFGLSAIHVKKFSAIKDSAIGRLVPPYLTFAQQSFANYMIREGYSPVPSIVFSSDESIVSDN